MLRDGATYAAVSKWLEVSGTAGITEDNVRNWHNGHGGPSGYLEWMQREERLDAMRRRSEWALEVVKSGDVGQFSEAAILEAASSLFEVSSEFDIGRLKSRLDDDPALYLELTKAIARLAKPELEFRKFKDQVARARKALDAATSDAKRAGGLTDETLRRIEEAAKLL